MQVYPPTCKRDLCNRTKFYSIPCSVSRAIQRDSDQQENPGQVRRPQIYVLTLSTLCRILAAKSASFSDDKLISTFASAPVTAPLASACAVVRSDFIFGLVIPSRLAAIPATSRAISATLSGTPVACFSAPSVSASLSLPANLDCLWAFITES